MAWFQSAFTARLDLRELAHSNPPTRASRLARVLSVGDHTDLLTYRAQVLKTAGYRVRSSVPCDACNLVSSAFYHVVVFGHSLPARECAQLATAIRGVSPETKLLLLNGFEPRALAMEQLFDTTLHCLEGPAALVSAVQGLLTSPPISEAHPQPASTTIFRPAPSLSRAPEAIPSYPPRVCQAGQVVGGTSRPEPPAGHTRPLPPSGTTSLLPQPLSLRHEFLRPFLFPKAQPPLRRSPSLRTDKRRLHRFQSVHVRSQSQRSYLGPGFGLHRQEAPARERRAGRSAASLNLRSVPQHPFRYFSCPSLSLSVRSHQPVHKPRHIRISDADPPHAHGGDADFAWPRRTGSAR